MKEKLEIGREYGKPKYMRVLSVKLTLIAF